MIRSYTTEGADVRTTALGASGLHLRQAETGRGYLLRGTFVPFRSRSNLLGTFYEIFEPGAFDDVLRDDVRALFNHDPDNLLGRTTNETLRLWTDQQGGHFECQLDDDHIATFVRKKVLRRDLTGCSFAFRMQEGDADAEEWRRDGSLLVRVVRRVGRLLDVGPVTYPAYEATEVSVQTLERGSRALGVDLHRRAKRHLAEVATTTLDPETRERWERYKQSCAEAMEMGVKVDETSPLDAHPELQQRAQMWRQHFHNIRRTRALTLTG
ncbi:MAG: HK97 family phage prohead protease [Gammaproteobacteria bacterium]|nr:MAG: HK97 family phage prohead protease [Gammaproteobacteria bacterium]